MPEMIDRISYLSQEIGPRPAGTEEEQQASAYIAESFEKEIGLPAEVEEFNAPSEGGFLRAVLASVMVIAPLLALLINVIAVPMLIVMLIALAVFVLEETGRPVVSRFLARGVSQNVVAKYVPQTGYIQTRRRRKVILVSRYDSGKVRSELNNPFVKVMPLLNKISAGAMIFVPVFAFLRMTLFAHAEGLFGIILNIITILSVVAVAVPLICKILQRFATYNEAANSNAAGVAVMMEAARRMASGTAVPEEPESDEFGLPLVHGEDAAREAGLVPEGAELSYDVEPTTESSEDGLLAAKAAIAMLTGKAVSTNNFIAEESASAAEGVEEAAEAVGEAAVLAAEPVQAAIDETIPAVASAPVEEVAAAPAPSVLPNNPLREAKSSVPDWFKSAQAKAKKSTSDAPVYRSRYADALDAAVNQSSTYIEEAENASTTMEEHLEKLNDGISYVAPPVEEAAAEVVPAVEKIAEMQEKAPVTAEPQPVPAEPQLAPAASEPEPVSSIAEVPYEPEVGVPAAATAAPSVVEAQPAIAAEPLMEEPAPADFASTPEPEPLPGFIDPVEQLASFSAGLNEIPTSSEVPLPAFLDPSNAQAEALEKRSERGAVRSSVAAGDDLDEALAADSLEAAPLSTGDIAAVANDAEPSEPKLGRPRIASLPSLSGEISAIKSRSGILRAVPSVESVTPSPEKAAAPRPSVKSLRSTIPSLSGELSKIKGRVASLTGPMKPVEDVYGDLEEEQPMQEVAETDSTEYAQPYDDADFAEEYEDYDQPIYDDDFEDEYADDPYGELVQDKVDEAPKKGFFANLMGRFSRKEKPAVREEAYSDDAWLDEDEDDRNWNGGAFSLKDKVQSIADRAGSAGGAAGRILNRNKADDVYGEVQEEADELILDEALETEPAEDAAPMEPEESIRAIRDFHNPYIDTEVWFVALGAELADNAGMKAFVAEHESDLRGAIIIELDSLGSGVLSYLEAEGAVRPAKCSSRMKRYIRKATQISGISAATISSGLMNSAASYANSHGFTAMHLAGMEDGKPAMMAQTDDVIENIDEDLLYENADFVMDLISVI